MAIEAVKLNHSEPLTRLTLYLHIQLNVMAIEVIKPIITILHEELMATLLHCVLQMP